MCFLPPTFFNLSVKIMYQQSWGQLSDNLWEQPTSTLFTIFHAPHQRGQKHILTRPPRSPNKSLFLESLLPSYNHVKSLRSPTPQGQRALPGTLQRWVCISSVSSLLSKNLLPKHPLYFKNPMKAQVRWDLLSPRVNSTAREIRTAPQTVLPF